MSSLAPKRTYEASRRLCLNASLYAFHLLSHGGSRFSLHPLETFVKRLSLASICRYTVRSPRAWTRVYDSPGIIQLDLSAFRDINRPCWLSGKCQGDCHRLSDEATYRCRFLGNNWPFCCSRTVTIYWKQSAAYIYDITKHTYLVLSCPGKILQENLVNSDITKRGKSSNRGKR